MTRLRRTIWSLLNEREGLGGLVEAFIITLITANVVAVVLESDPSLTDADSVPYWSAFEVFSSVVFTIEYLLRLWCAVEHPRYAHPVRGRLRYMRTPLALVDLVAILPFWLPMVTSLDTRVLRALRLFRLFRLLKIGRYSSAISALARVFSRKADELSMTFFAVSLSLIVFASLMYFVENPAQPTVFTSITQTMWWAIATLTTVGYGDMYPITTAGQIIGGLIAVTGVVMIAVPSGIVASGFTEEIEERRRAEALQRANEEEEERRAMTEAAPEAHADAAHHACPHCGKPIALRLEPPR